MLEGQAQRFLWLSLHPHGRRAREMGNLLPQLLQFVPDKRLMLLQHLPLERNRYLLLQDQI